jgi:hypothetical protein
MRSNLTSVVDSGTVGHAAAAMNEKLVQVGKFEGRLPAETTESAVAEARRAFAQEATEFRALYDTAWATAGAQHRAALTEARRLADAYLAGAQRTLSIAEAAAAGRASRADVLAAMRENEARYNAADDALEGPATLALDIMRRNTAEAAVGASFATLSMLAISILGLLGSSLLGWLIGARGLSQPIAASVTRLRALTERTRSATSPAPWPCSARA